MNRKRTINRVGFTCQKCGAPADLSPEHYRRCVREERPLECFDCSDKRRKESRARSIQKLPRAVYHCEECGQVKVLTIVHAEHHKALGKRIFVLLKACVSQDMMIAAVGRAISGAITGGQR